MATHGCILCPGCKTGCPLCGRCRCKIEELQKPKAFTLADSIREEIDREILGELFALADKNEEQKPETD